MPQAKPESPDEARTILRFPARLSPGPRNRLGNLLNVNFENSFTLAAYLFCVQHRNSSHSTWLSTPQHSQRDRPPCSHDWYLIEQPLSIGKNLKELAANDASTEVWSCEDPASTGIIGSSMGRKEPPSSAGWTFRRWLPNEHPWKNISFLGFITCSTSTINKHHRRRRRFHRHHYQTSLNLKRGWTFPSDECLASILKATITCTLRLSLYTSSSDAWNFSI